MSAKQNRRRAWQRLKAANAGRRWITTSEIRAARRPHGSFVLPDVQELAERELDSGERRQKADSNSFLRSKVHASVRTIGTPVSMVGAFTLKDI